jgi:hypothetical protein
VPVVQIGVDENKELHRAAVELAALKHVGRDLDPMDRVLAQEVRERTLMSEQTLEKMLEQLVSARRRGSTRLLHGPSTSKLSAQDRLSGLVSTACDLVFHDTPIVRNEMIAGRVLSSQGAKALRLLTEAMIRDGDQPRFGIVGDAAEGSIFDSVIQRSGLLDGECRTSDEIAKSWTGLLSVLKTALLSPEESKIEATQFIAIATKPPYGIRLPLAKLVVVALIWKHKESVAIYEHGSLLLHLDEAVAERLVKNPDHFYFKPIKPTSRLHQTVLNELRKVLLPDQTTTTMLDIVTALIRRLSTLPAFSLSTNARLSDAAIALRQVVRTATEPDSLLFTEIPQALGIAPTTKRTARAFAELMLSSMRELEGVYLRMICEIDDLIRNEMHIRETAEHPSVLLRGSALAIRDNLMEPQLRSLINAMLREGLSPAEWTENVAMVVSGQGSPRNWTDEKFQSFEVLLVEQMNTFRRLLGLNIQSAGSSSNSSRFAMVTVTNSDGHEHERIIHLTEQHLDFASQCGEQALDRLMTIAGSSDDARHLLIAALLTRSETSDRSRDISSSVVIEAPARGTQEA